MRYTHGLNKVPLSGVVLAGSLGRGRRVGHDDCLNEVVGGSGESGREWGRTVFGADPAARSI
jgi:hypothetical protein